MSVRDLGYRAYEGELLPASHNLWVLMRYGLWRIWGSWINRIVVISAFFMDLGWCGVPGLRFLLLQGSREIPEVPPEAPAIAHWFMNADPGAFARPFMAFQFWFFVTVVTLRSGAGVIAEDFTHRAYQFYFAKPVTPLQYLAGRIGGLSIFLFALVAVPTCLFIATTVALGPEDVMLERMGLLLPALFDALIMSVSSAILSISISALSKSRALTMTAWAVLTLVPFILAVLVEAITDTEWLYAASLPGLLWVTGDGLFKVETTWQHLHWYHTLPILAAACAGGCYFAYSRIRKAEVIT